MVEIKKGFNLNTPTWSELLFELNYSHFNDEKLLIKDSGFFVSYYAHRINKIQEVLKELKLTTAHIYFNLFQNTTCLPAHEDKMDVWFWQVKGFSKWILHNGTEEWILKEGDLIYLPKGTNHQVIPLGVRAGISMGNELDIDYLKDLF